jgi:hypothetical protein
MDKGAWGAQPARLQQLVADMHCRTQCNSAVVLQASWVREDNDAELARSAAEGKEGEKGVHGLPAC